MFFSSCFLKLKTPGRIFSGIFSILLFILYFPQAGMGFEPPGVFVLNSIDETVSCLELKTGKMSNHIMQTGTWPNQIVIHENKGYVVNSGDASITVFTPSTGEILSVFSLPNPFSNPWEMVFGNNGLAYLSAAAENTVYKLDMNSGSVLDQVYVGRWPEGLLIHDARLYVAVTGFDMNTWSYIGSSVKAIDLETFEVADSLLTHTNPQDLAYNGGKIYAVCTGDYFSEFGVLEVMDPHDLKLQKSVQIGGSPGKVNVSAYGSGYLADFGFMSYGLYVLDAIADTVTMGPANPFILEPCGDVLALDALNYLFAATFQSSGGMLHEYSLPGENYLNSYAAGAGCNSIEFWLEPSAVSVSLDPAKISLKPGANLDVSVTIKNHLNESAGFYALVNLYLPDGEPYKGNPVSGPRWIELKAEETVNAVMIHKIPSKTPQGRYTYKIFLTKNTGMIISRDFFVFEVVPI